MPDKEIAHSVSVGVARLLRNERKRQLAKKSGLSQPMISYIETRICNPTLDTLLRIAAALDVDLSKLLKQALRCG